MDNTEIRVEERIEFSRPADMSFMEIMSVENTVRHFSAVHSSYTICANLTRGGADWLYRGTKESGHGRMLMLMEPGETHRTLRLHGAPASFRVLHLDADWVKRRATEVGLSSTPHFSVGMLRHPGVFAALVSFCAATRGRASLLERETLLLRFLDRLFISGLEQVPRLTSMRGSARKIYLAHDYLVDNCDKQVDLEDLAAVTNLTRFHLIRSFAREFGLTPHAFLNHVRVNRARERLRRRERVNGCELGFFDQSHFIRVFRSFVGVTPAQYRESERARKAKALLR